MASWLCPTPRLGLAARRRSRRRPCSCPASLRPLGCLEWLAVRVSLSRVVRSLAAAFVLLLLGLGAQARPPPGGLTPEADWFKNLHLQPWMAKVGNRQVARREIAETPTANPKIAQDEPRNVVRGEAP